MEHRWGQRIQLRLRVTTLTGRKVVTAHTRNISLSGAWLETASTEVWPAACFLRLELPTIGSFTRTVLSYVVRRTDEGVGVEWAGFAPRLIRQLVLPHIDARSEGSYAVGGHKHAASAQTLR